jgi:hypothetical protein
MATGKIHNVCVGRLDMSLWLQGRSRISLDKLRTQVRILTKFEDVSEFILIHIGDIAKLDLKETRKKLRV